MHIIASVYINNDEGSSFWPKLFCAGPRMLASR
jgi:hypothetical protein